jgi:plastocyanin
MLRPIAAVLVMGTAMSFGSTSARAAEDFSLVIKDHQFSPAELTIPAGQKVKVHIDNQDSTPEEFESHDLNREKVIPGKGQGVVFLGPLEAGTYEYYGEFHMKTAKGKIIAR